MLIPQREWKSSELDVSIHACKHRSLRVIDLQGTAMRVWWCVGQRAVLLILSHSRLECLDELVVQ